MTKDDPSRIDIPAEELERHERDHVPERGWMPVIDANVAAPVNVASALDVRHPRSTEPTARDSPADQTRRSRRETIPDEERAGPV